MSKRMMSQKNYIQCGGQNCPFCHGEDCVEGVDSVEIDGGIGFQTVK